MSNSIEAFDRGDNFDYGLWNDAETRLVGGAGLHPRLGLGRLEIGYWVGAGWLRRGFASSAARALTRTAFELPEIEEVHIRCDEANIASARVPRTLGFQLMRIVDDEVSAPAEVGRSMDWVLSVSDQQREN
jgi:RimJ/RimL family protein N-acetyltransferase